MRRQQRQKHRLTPAIPRALSAEGTLYRSSVLPSGLRIVTEQVPSVHSVALGIWIDAGSRDEDPRENGISHFIEHSVFKGTRSRRTHHIAQYLEAVGGYLNAFTTKDTTCYYARVLRPHLPRAVHLLADILMHPMFPQQEIQKEKQVIIEELRGAEDDPEDLVHERFEELLYGTHSLAQPVLGRERNITMFTRDDLVKFVRKHYTAENIVVAAAGAVDHDHLAALCAEEFAELKHGEPTGRIRPRKRKARREVHTRPIQQSHLVLGAMTGGYHGKDRH